MSTSSRIAIVGAGNVGATAAYVLMLRGLFAEIVLIDHTAERAVAQAADIADANAIVQPVRIWGGDYADVRDAGILVVTAGASTGDGEPRTAVAGKSAAIVRECVQQAMDAGFDGIIIVSSNPADAMAQVAQATSGLPPERVIGTGTLLDSNRLRKRIADRIGVAPASVEALVLGEHGDSEVIAYSTVRIGGMTLNAWLGEQALDRDQVAEGVVARGLRDQRRQGPYCVWCGIDDRTHLRGGPSRRAGVRYRRRLSSLPCLVGAGGVLRVLTPELSGDEQAALRASADVLRETMQAAD